MVFQFEKGASCRSKWVFQFEKGTSCRSKWVFQVEKGISCCAKCLFRSETNADNLDNNAHYSTATHGGTTGSIPWTAPKLNWE